MAISSKTTTIRCFVKQIEKKKRRSLILQIDWWIREFLRWLFHLLSLNTKFRSKLNMQLRYGYLSFEFWFHYFESKKTFFFVGNTTRWYCELLKFKCKTKERYRTIIVNRLCSTETLHHFLWTLLSSFLRFTHVWVLWQTFVTFFVFTNSFDLKKTQSPCW